MLRKVESQRTRKRAALLLLAAMYLWTAGFALLLHHHCSRQGAGTSGRSPVCTEVERASVVESPARGSLPADTGHCALCQWFLSGAIAPDLGSRLIESAGTPGELGLATSASSFPALLRISSPRAPPC